MTILRPAEAAERLRISRSHLYDLVNEGVISKDATLHVPGLRIVLEQAVEDLKRWPGRPPGRRRESTG